MPSRLICTPESQARAISVVIEAYQKWNENRCPDAVLTDFITDLLHWADQNNVVFLEVLAVATQHYELERRYHEEGTDAMTTEQ
jgi:hypothetical protein